MSKHQHIHGLVFDTSMATSETFVSDYHHVGVAQHVGIYGGFKSATNATITVTAVDSADTEFHVEIPGVHVEQYSFKNL